MVNPVDDGLRGRGEGVVDDGPLGGAEPTQHVINRAFLRCMHGYGLCLWRLGDFTAAKAVFERMLSFNPNDDQGVRFCWDDVRYGRSWEEMQEKEDEVRAQRRQSLH